MYATNIARAARRLETFGLTSKRFSLYFLASSVIMLIMVTVLVPGFSLFQILTGSCMLILPAAAYFSSTVLVTNMTGVRWCKLNQPQFAKRFNFSLNGPFNGVRWFDLFLTFLSGSAVMLVDVFTFAHFGYYPLLLVAAIILWLVVLFRLYRRFKHSIHALEAFSKRVGSPTDEIMLSYVREARKGNVEVLIDKRDAIDSL